MYRPDYNAGNGCVSNGVFTWYESQLVVALCLTNGRLRKNIGGILELKCFSCPLF